uniref:cGMP-dependent protein kinase n=1 Tax=Plectus sambesii TaxID=2011161 RepID=A0A914XKX9_9BILA
MATLREFQIALQDKLEEIVQRDEIIDDLEREIAEKDRKIESLMLELGKYRTLVSNSSSLTSPTQKLTPTVHITRPPANVVLQQATKVESTPIICGGSTGSSFASMTQFPPTGALLGVKEKRAAISGESSSSIGSSTTSHHSKNQKSRELIKNALLANDFLRHLDLEQICEMVECMYNVDVAKNCLIIREGDDGSLVYVMEDGTVEVSKDGRYLCTLAPGKVFGELAILYNCTRTASVRAMTACRLWAINRQTFQAIMMKTGMAKHSEYVSFLQSIPIFQDLAEEKMHRLADLLVEETFKYGEYIARQGSSGSTFFIISKGQVRVTTNVSQSQLTKVKAHEKTVKTLAVGDFFGEQALFDDDIRTANYVVSSHEGCTCLTIDRDSYNELIRRRDDGRTTGSPIGRRSVTLSPEFTSLRLGDLRIVATLGVGGFGRVELVHAIGDGSKSFALKVMRKKHIVETKQQTHIMNERNIMFECHSEFIVRLYRTFRDAKYLYMLMESCLGGEVWSLLRDRSRFDEHTSRFYTACAMEALEYLHRRGIIYRDLKPENMLVDESGYAKLVDFGFAKHIGFSRKTWTFCGTPEYVAPEVVLNKGHDYAVDFWSLGIFIFELLTGSPPFVAPDPMRTYNTILKGIDALDFPRHMSKNAIVIIKKLCRELPNERLGCGRGGFKDIRRNRWFDCFNFDGLKNRTLQPPILPNIKNAIDTSNFDEFPPDEEPPPPDDISGWDEDF